MNERQRGRPKGPIKSKTSIRVSDRLRDAISVLICFNGCRNYSDAIEKATIEVARKIVVERGIEGHFPEL